MFSEVSAARTLANPSRPRRAESRVRRGHLLTVIARDAGGSYEVFNSIPELWRTDAMYNVSAFVFLQFPLLLYVADVALARKLTATA